MLDQDPEFSQEYRLSRLGFFLLAVGLVPICVIEVVALAADFVGLSPIPLWLHRLGAWELLDTLTPWATLAGSTVLWCAWDAPGWRRRAGLLMSMCLVDVASWFLNLGDAEMQGRHAWFRLQLGEALGWAQFALMASLAGDLLTHLGSEDAEESSKSTRSLIASGAVLWLLLFCERTDLAAGWPLRPNGRLGPPARLLWVGQIMIQVICLVQVAALVTAAYRRVDQELGSRDADGKSGDDDFGDLAGLGFGPKVDGPTPL